MLKVWVFPSVSPLFVFVYIALKDMFTFQGFLKTILTFPYVHWVSFCCFHSSCSHMPLRDPLRVNMRPQQSQLIESIGILPEYPRFVTTDSAYLPSCNAEIVTQRGNFVLLLIWLIHTAEASYEFQIHCGIYFYAEKELWILSPITYTGSAIGRDLACMKRREQKLFQCPHGHVIMVRQTWKSYRCRKSMWPSRMEILI